MIDGGEEQEGIALEKKWEEMRPRVIRPLGEFLFSDFLFISLSFSSSTHHALPPHLSIFLLAFSYIGVCIKRISESLYSQYR